MSVIQRIRDKAAWFVFGAIALSLIAFILQDAFSGKTRMFFSSTSIGSVNGSSIDKDEYEHKLQLFEQLSGRNRSDLMSNMWDRLVQQTVMQKEFNKLGLTVTSKELSDVLFGPNPPSWLQQAFTDPQTGVYNADMARQQFSQIKKNADDAKSAQLYEGYLEPTMYQTIGEKYQSLIVNAIYVPKWMAEKENADNNSLANISFVSVPYTTISDSSVKVSDQEIQDYIAKHPKQYKQKEETRQLSYVSFSAKPSVQDTNAVKEQLEQVQNEFATTTDEKSFLSRNSSEMTFYDSYLGKSKIQQPQKDSLFALSPGQVYGPYLDNNNLVIAKLIAERQIPDSVKVRHILVSTMDPQQGVRTRSDSAASKRLDSAIAEIKAGVPFDSVCLKYSDDGNAKTGGVYDYFPTGTMVAEFNDFVFTGKTGDTKVVKTDYGYHYVEILGQRGSETGYKFAYLSKPIVASQETINAANDASLKFASESRTSKEFTDNAAKLGKTPQVADNIKSADNNVEGVGDNRTLVRWAYEHNPGEISEPFETTDGFIVAMLTAVNKKGLQSPAMVRPSVEPILRNQKKAQMIIASKIKGNSLQEVANATQQTVQTADSISFNAFSVTGIGNEPKISGAAFNKALQNKMSAPIAGNSAVFLIQGNGIFAGASLGNNAETTKQQLEMQLKSMVGYTSMNALIDAADVDDERSKFY